ncbi:MAG: hypothetical protein N3B18_12480 [Desulfobacterota bacterium]|nr:hypothetical protein [Thermodesulfobacteriota bacterium]
MNALLRYLLVSICCIGAGCTSTSQSDLLLFGFERDADLDRLWWYCKTMYTRAREHATQGEYSLKVDFYPSHYPRFEPLMRTQDWSRYRALCFDIYNPSDSIITVTLRIDDRRTSPAFYDCHIQYLKLRPGHNAITIGIASLKGCKTQRPLRTKEIRRFMVFMYRPDRQHTLYFDNIKLVL